MWSRQSEQSDREIARFTRESWIDVNRDTSTPAEGNFSCFIPDSRVNRDASTAAHVRVNFLCKLSIILNLKSVNQIREIYLDVILTKQVHYSVQIHDGVLDKQLPSGHNGDMASIATPSPIKCVPSEKENILNALRSRTHYTGTCHEKRWRAQNGQDSGHVADWSIFGRIAIATSVSQFVRRSSWKPAELVKTDFPLLINKKWRRWRTK